MQVVTIIENRIHFRKSAINDAGTSKSSSSSSSSTDSSEFIDPGDGDLERIRALMLLLFVW